MENRETNTLFVVHFSFNLYEIFSDLTLNGDIKTTILISCLFWHWGLKKKEQMAFLSMCLGTLPGLNYKLVPTGQGLFWCLGRSCHSTDYKVTSGYLNSHLALFCFGLSFLLSNNWFKIFFWLHKDLALLKDSIINLNWPQWYLTQGDSSHLWNNGIISAVCVRTSSRDRKLLTFSAVLM